ncbi:hypothetical protein LAZ67_1001082 [Cordylochernes scorpioides]|uniref:Integrase catalytic domain-containing protein n=1 Tax=Cordylochernes scorpioides TaxID=51811 RepID=A0ABY6JWI3_9ARAC|nr:hypothetical protein LAZ67_1001082 [Cordylochernes scorpioides]
MKKNQKLRTLLRSSATKSIREIDAEMEKESPSRETIGIKFKVLETIENQLRDANVQVMNLMLEDEAISPPDLEKEQDMVVQYEENFVRTELRVAEYLQVKENGRQGRGTLDPTRSAQEGMSSCKLPKKALPVYDGTCLEWLGWWSRFEMIHESAVLSEVEKFQYLVQSMKAGTRADRLVRSYPLIPENYPKVVKALKDRFGDSNILTEVYVRQLLKLVINNVRRKNLSLEGMYDQLESHLRSLESLGVTVRQNACFLYPMVESSLPEDLLRIWQRSALAGYGGDELELPITIDQRLERLLEFLRREVKGEQRLEYMKEGFRESSQRRNYGQHIARMHAAQTKAAQGRDCSGWRSMTVTKRMDEIRKVNACFCCLRVVHVIATCRTQIRCSHCKGPHHTTLHLPRRVSMEDRDKRERQNTEEPRVSPGEQEIALSGMHVRTAIPTALLAIARVRLVGPRGVGVTVRALLDQADPQFETSGRVDVILGADVYGSLLLPEVKYDEKTQLCAQKTRLGWIISGKLPGEGEVGPHRVYNIRVPLRLQDEQVEMNSVKLKIRVSGEYTGGVEDSSNLNDSVKYIEEYNKEIVQSEDVQVEYNSHEEEIPLQDHRMDRSLTEVLKENVGKENLSDIGKDSPNSATYLKKEATKGELTLKRKRKGEKMGHNAKIDSAVREENVIKREEIPAKENKTNREMETNNKVKIKIIAKEAENDEMSVDLTHPTEDRDDSKASKIEHVLEDPLEVQSTGQKIREKRGRNNGTSALAKVVARICIDDGENESKAKDHESILQNKQKSTSVIRTEKDAIPAGKPQKVPEKTKEVKTGQKIKLKGKKENPKDDAKPIQQSTDSLGITKRRGRPNEVLEKVTPQASPINDKIIPKAVKNTKEIKANPEPARDKEVKVKSGIEKVDSVVERIITEKTTTEAAGKPQEKPILVTIGERCSSLTTCIGIVAWILRFINNCRDRSRRVHTYLTTAELRQAHDKILLAVQLYCFDEDLKNLHNQKMVRKNKIPYDQRHPALLPSTGKLSQLIIRDAHSRTLHGGVHLVLATLRQKYWILKAKNQIKKCIRDCLTCCRYNRVTQHQLMSDLPKERLTLESHLQGHCAQMYSDQGTNFVGAAKQLRIGFYLARDQMSEIAEILANDGTEWKFNPPGAPHFGGLWEAGIKCFRYHFRRIIGDTLLTYEEFLTLIVQIEACLNSRPLGPISGDPNDLAVLTPAHFLLTSSSYCVPEEDLLNVGVQLLPRWKMVQKMVQHLWRQWSTDYIHNLQQRHKWRMPRPNVATGSLVLVREEHVPPAKWMMGRVVEIHPGKDGLVRVVSIRTKAGVLKRPLSIRTFHFNGHSDLTYLQEHLTIYSMMIGGIDSQEVDVAPGQVGLTVRGTDGIDSKEVDVAPGQVGLTVRRCMLLQDRTDGIDSQEVDVAPGQMGLTVRRWMLLQDRTGGIDSQGVDVAPGQMGLTVRRWMSLQDSHEANVVLGQVGLTVRRKCSAAALVNTLSCLSPIENVWSMVTEQQARNHTPVTTVDELWHHVEAAGEAVPAVHVIQSLLDSMPRRILLLLLSEVVLLCTDFSGSTPSDFF